jgi:hypothetical protein
MFDLQREANARRLILRLAAALARQAAAEDDALSWREVSTNACRGIRSLQ